MPNDYQMRTLLKTQENRKERGKKSTKNRLLLEKKGEREKEKKILKNSESLLVLYCKISTNLKFIYYSLRTIHHKCSKRMILHHRLER